MDPGVSHRQSVESMQHVPALQSALVLMQQTPALAPAMPMWTKQHALKVVLVFVACVTMVMSNNKLRDLTAVDLLLQNIVSTLTKNLLARLHMTNTACLINLLLELPVDLMLLLTLLELATLPRV